MDYASPIREEIVPASSVPANADRCPRCKGGTIIIHGHLEYPYASHLEDGVEVEVQQERSCTTQTVEAITCLVCQTRFIIMQKREFELQKTVGDLTTKLQEAKGTRPN